MNLLNLKQESTKDIEIKGLKFKIRAILPSDDVEISVKKSFLLNGLPIESFMIDEVRFFQKLATIDVCAEFGDELLDAKIRIARDIPDRNVIEDVYKEIVSLTEDLERKLKKNKSFERSSEK